jgi:hypothetical protein
MRMLALSLSLACLVLGSWTPTPAEEKKDKAKKEDADVKQPNERESRILELFTATKKNFTKDGRLQLVYSFETRQQDLVEDWSPALDAKNPRIRWTRPGEYTWSALEYGIIIGDYGEWMHEATFLADGLEVTVDQSNAAAYKAGTISAAVLYNDKKKLSLGVNAGAQAVVLKGFRLAKPPIPRAERKVLSNQRYKAGYRIKGSVIECILNGSKLGDTADNVKFTDGFDRGRVGLAWSGSVQSFIHQVTIKGTLDPEWVQKALGEIDTSKADKKSKTVKKAEPPKAGGTK